MENFDYHFDYLDVQQILGVGRSELQAWVQRGFLSPSIRCSNTSGVRHLYSREDLYGIALFQRFAVLGFQRKLIADMMRALHEALDGNPMKRFRYASFCLAAGGVTAVVASTSRPLVRSRTEDPILIVYLDDVISQVDNCIEGSNDR